jgi:hypothetical protein
MKPDKNKMKRNALYKRKSERLKSRGDRSISTKSEWRNRKDSVLFKCKKAVKKNGESVRKNNYNSKRSFRNKGMTFKSLSKKIRKIKSK